MLLSLLRQPDLRRVWEQDKFDIILAQLEEAEKQTGSQFSLAKYLISFISLYYAGPRLLSFIRLLPCETITNESKC